MGTGSGRALPGSSGGLNAMASLTVAMVAITLGECQPLKLCIMKRAWEREEVKKRDTSNRVSPPSLPLT